MANINITVQSLLNTATYDPYTIDNGQTINQLKAAIQAATGVDVAWFDIVHNNSVASGSATLTSLGITSGTKLRTHNKIARLATLELRQKAKLSLAALDRTASGNLRDIYDISELPTQYSGNQIINNYNPAGLIEGRPWISTPTVITDGLLVYVDANNTASYPGSGATWTNLVDSTNYTIVSGSFNNSSGIKSIVFNGTSTYVDIGQPLNAGTNYTIEAWVYASAVNFSHNVVSSENNVFWIASGTLYGGVGGSYQLVSSGSFPLTTWKHVTLTFNDITDTMTLYINGAQVNQNTAVTESFLKETMRIGSHFAGGNPVSFWNGRISQVRIYNKELSSTEVGSNFDLTKTTFGV